MIQLGCLMTTLGTNLMKLGHTKANDSVSSNEEKKLTAKSVREWQYGASLFAAGNVANFASFAFAAQSLLASLGTVEFVFNAIFARAILKEVLTLHVLTGTGGVILGLILLVVFGNRDTNEFDASELAHLYRNPGYITFLAVGGTTFVVTCGMYKWGKQRINLNKSIGHSPFQRRILPLTYAIFSALVGSQSVLFSKCLSNLLRKTISGDSQLKAWFTWVCLFLFLCTATFWVLQLNRGLKMFGVLEIVPLMQISWTLLAIISGGVYFEEFEQFSKTQATMFCVGITIAIGSVYVLIGGGGANARVVPEEGRTESPEQLYPSEKISNQGNRTKHDPLSSTEILDGSVSIEDPVDRDTPRVSIRALEISFDSDPKERTNASVSSCSDAIDDTRREDAIGIEGRCSS